jgi:hypothetical protein
MTKRKGQRNIPEPQRRKQDSSKGKWRKKRKPTQVEQGLELGFIQLDGFKAGKQAGGGAGVVLATPVVSSMYCKIT